MLSGFADEWTQEKEAPERRLGRVKEFNGKLLEVTVKNENVHEEFDYLEIEVNCGAPQDFGGYSGGGLWQILITEGENGEPINKGRVLSGVAFCQSGINDGIRTIKCHGRKSIYQNAIEKFREWKSQ